VNTGVSGDNPYRGESLSVATIMGTNLGLAGLGIVVSTSYSIPHVVCLMSCELANKITRGKIELAKKGEKEETK